MKHNIPANVLSRHRAQADQPHVLRQVVNSGIIFSGNCSSHKVAAAAAVLQILTSVNVAAAQASCDRTDAAAPEAGHTHFAQPLEM